MDALLCDYVYRHNYDEAKECLESYGANANARESKKKGGASALWYAAGDDDQVRLGLELGLGLGLGLRLGL